RRPSHWHEGNVHERLGLPPRVQGTGMATEEARSFHTVEIALFMQYVEEAWPEYDAYLAGISDGGVALSERIVPVKPVGEMPSVRAIGQVCISHLFIHYGEMSVILGTMGKRGLPV